MSEKGDFVPSLNTKFIRKRLIPALLSGDYKQGYRGLKTDGYTGLKIEEGDGKPVFCCLGVICDLLIQDGIGDPWKDDDYGNFYSTDNYICYLPPYAGEYVGVDDSFTLNSRFAQEHYPEIKNLVIANDGHNDFHWIATALAFECDEAESIARGE